MIELMMNDTMTETATVNVGFAILLPTLILIAVVMNLGTIVAFWKVPSILRENPSELLILNLACADLLTGTTVLPLAAPLYITPDAWPFGEIGCAILVFFMNLSMGGSLFALITISVDRFLLVYMEYPRYVKTMTRKRVNILIASGWIFALLAVVIELSLWEKAKTIDKTAEKIDFNKECLSPPRRVQAFTLSFILMLFLFPVLLVCGLSTAFMYQLRLRLQNTRERSVTTCSIDTLKSIDECASAATGIDNKSQDDLCRNEPESVRQPTTICNSTETIVSSKQTRRRESLVKNRYIKPGITLIGVVLAMAICMLPFAFYVIIIESGCEECNDNDILYGLFLMQLCNACINPFIYVLTRRKIRKFYDSLLMKFKVHVFYMIGKTV